MKKVIKAFLNLFGLELRKKLRFDSSESYLFKDLMVALNNSQSRGVDPLTVVDVGASQGKWSLAAMNIWPESNYVLFEPLTERKDELEALQKKYKNIHYVPVGAGSRKEKVGFYVSDDLDGSGVASNQDKSKVRQVDVTTIDEEISRLKLEGPFVIKLDTHGFEVPILEGAEETLKNSQLVIIECYLFQVAAGSLLLWEMCQYMDNLGFRMVDMVDLMWRKRDNALWQCDVFFVPKSSPCFEINSFD